MRAVAEVIPIRRVAIVGAGTMGAGIAMAAANAGLDVDADRRVRRCARRGLAVIRKNYDISVSRGRLTADGVAERMARIRQSTRPALS